MKEKRKITPIQLVALCNVLQSSVLRYHGQFDSHGNTDLENLIDLEDTLKHVASEIRQFVKQERDWFKK